MSDSPFPRRTIAALLTVIATITAFGAGVIFMVAVEHSPTSVVRENPPPTLDSLLPAGGAGLLGAADSLCSETND